MIDRIHYTPLRQSILQLQYAVDELESEASMEEIRQLRAMIEKGISDVLAGNLSDADERFALIQKRINYLAGS